MSKKELKRLSCLEKVCHHELTQQQAAEQLKLSSRQVRRLQWAYEREGTQGLQSKRRGRPSNNILSPELTHLTQSRTNMSFFAAPEVQSD